MRIRKAKTSDVPILAKLGMKTFKNKKSVTEDVRKYLRQCIKENRIFCAVEKDKLVGYVTFNKNLCMDTLNMESICVDAEHRSNGVGRKLLDRVKKQAKKDSFDSIFVDTWLSNKRAISFYLKNGFRKMGLVRGMYAASTNAIVMACHLVARA